MTKKFEKFTKQSKNASATSAVMENKQLTYDPSDTQNFYAINLLSNVALSQHNQSSKNTRYSENTEASSCSLQNEIDHVNKHRYYALGIDEICTTFLLNYYSTLN